MKEIWKNIVGYDGYQVSNLGNVRTYNKTTYTKKHGIRHWKNRNLKPRLDKRNKMLSVNLWKDGKGKSYLIYRLVAEAFLPNPNNLKTVNHKDGNRLNNNINNLEWLSLKDNIRHGFENKLYSNQIPIKITNKDKNETYKFRSMSEASYFIKKNKGYISGKIKKNIYENENFKWGKI